MSQTSTTVAQTHFADRLGRGLRWAFSRGVLYSVIILLSIMFGFPFFWSVTSSLKSAPELNLYPPTVFPKTPLWSNYVRVFTIAAYPFAKWFANTVFLVAINTAGSLSSSMLVAYGFSRFRFRGKDLLFMITLGTMMIPSGVTLIPKFILFYKFGWLNTFKPLWVPAWFGGGAFSIFLLRQFFLTLPMELDEAAKIDGAGYWRVFLTILVPLCKPVIATLALMSFMSNWGNFMGPLIYLNDPDKYTLAIGLRLLVDMPETGSAEPLEHILMAGAVLFVIPCIIVFFSGQRYFVKGIAMTGIKG